MYPIKYPPQEIHQMLSKIVSSNPLHAKWLNTLSYLENCGARKIAACEHPTMVKEEMLKHAAEEFRHAHHLKRQIMKISPFPLETYSPGSILGGSTSWHYLTALDLQCSRYLKNMGFDSRKLVEMAYLLVTYAIEVRAEVLYTVYDSVLRSVKSPVAIKAILLEEKEHLNEMREGIALLNNGDIYSKRVCEIESVLFHRWVAGCMHDTKKYNKYHSNT